MQRRNIREIKQRSVQGGAITLAAQGVTVCLSLVSTMVLARFLGPEDYGVIAMVTAITAFAALFQDLGLSASTIQNNELTREQVSTFYWINVAAGTTLTLIVAACSPLFGWFYGRPELTPIALALSTNFFISSLGAQHGALLAKQMKFGRRAISSIGGGAVSLGVGVAAAANGLGHWSLVASILGGSLASTLLVITVSGWRPGLPAWGGGIRHLLSFGAHVTGFELVNYFHRNLDNILIGRVWGADAVGLYSRAYHLLMFPITNIRGPINAVAFPAMSKLQHSPDLFRAYFQRISALLAFVSMPLVAYLCIGSRPLIEVLLGGNWLAVSPLFTVLAITAFIQPVAGLRGLVLLATGQGKRYLQWGMANTLATVIAFSIGVVWGAMGVAIAYGIVNYALLYPSLVFAFRRTAIRPMDFLAAVFRPAASSIGAAAVAVWVLTGLSAAAPLMQIVAGAACFGTAYVGIFLALPGGRAEIRSHIGLTAQLRHQPA
jgi:PST family polysaccharide transporter